MEDAVDRARRWCASTAHRLRPWTALLVSGLTVAILAKAVADGTLPDPGSIHWGWTAMFMVAVVLTNILISGLRWALFLPAGYTTGWAVRRYSEASFWGVMLPFGGDVYRSLGGRRLIDSVVTDRLVSGAVLLAAALASAAAFALPVTALAVITAVVLSLLTGWLALRPRLLRTPTQHGAARVSAGMLLTVAYLVATALTLQAGALAGSTTLGFTDALIAAPLMVVGALLPAFVGLSPNLLVLGWVLGRSGADATEIATTVALFAAAGLMLIAVGGITIVAGRVASTPRSSRAGDAGRSAACGEPARP